MKAKKVIRRNFVNGRTMLYDGEWRFTCPLCKECSTAISAPLLVSNYQCSECGEILPLRHPRVGLGKVWLPCEIQYLRIHYPVKLNEDICQELGRPITGLQTKASDLNLHKGPAFFDFETGECWKGGRSDNHPFDPKYDGAISIRKYGEGTIQYIRVSSSVWRPLHRQRWEAANGHVPAMHILSFKDGDTMNADLDNIELVHKKTQIKKHTFNRYPLELQQQILLTAKLVRKIKSNASK